MSAKTKVARPVKPKAVAADAAPAAPAQPAPAQTPAQPAPDATVAQPAPAQPAPAQPVDAAVKDESSSKRQQTSHVIGCEISSARTRRHLDRMNLNLKIDWLISELKTPLDKYKHAKACLDSGKISVKVEKEVEKDGQKTKQVASEERPLTDAEKASFQETVNQLQATVPRLEADIAALSRERIRFSNTASVTLSIICDKLIQSVVEHAFNSVLAVKKKIIQIEHLHTEGVQALALYPLIRNLPTFSATAARLAAEQTKSASEEALAVALANAEKEFKKKYNVHLKKKAPEPQPDPATVAQIQQAAIAAAQAPAPAPAPVTEEHVDEEDDDSTKTTFKFYVQQVCKKMIKNDTTGKYKSVRVSTEIRAYLSDLLVEFIRRLSPLIHQTAVNMRNKTINDVAVLQTVKSLLIDGHAAVDTIEIRDEQVVDAVAYKAEVAKRDAAKKEGKSYTIDMDKLPRVAGRVAYRSVSYPTSGYAALEAEVKEKLELYKASLHDDEEEEAEHQEAVAAQ